MKPLDECRVLVTPRSFGNGSPELREHLERALGEVRYNKTGRALNSAELRHQIAGMDGLLAGLDEVDAAVFDAAAETLKVVARYGVGYSNVDLDAAVRHGVIVTNTPGANTEAVAELTIGLMFALSRSLPRAAAEVRSGSWRAIGGFEIAGRTVGLIGLGRIGRSVARRAENLGCRVLAFDPYVSAEDIERARIQPHSLQTVQRESDFISLHAPITDETNGLVDDEFLQQCHAGAFLINTARGELVDEEALLAALNRGHIAGAALDTLRQEPPKPANPLTSHPNVIVTPHIGAHTAEAATTMGQMAVADLLAVLSGRPAKNPVSQQNRRELRTIPRIQG